MTSKPTAATAEAPILPELAKGVEGTSIEDVAEVHLVDQGLVG